MEKIDYRLYGANIFFFGDDSAFEECCLQLKESHCNIYKNKAEAENDIFKYVNVYDFAEYNPRRNQPVSVAIIANEDSEAGQYLCACAWAARIPLVQSRTPSAYANARVIDLEEEKRKSDDSALRVGVISSCFHGSYIKKELVERFLNFDIELFELKAPDFEKLNGEVGIPNTFKEYGATEEKVRELMENPDAVAYHALETGEADIVLIESIQYRPLPFLRLEESYDLISPKDSRTVLLSKEGFDDVSEVPEDMEIVAASLDLSEEVFSRRRKHIFEANKSLVITDDSIYGLKNILKDIPDSAFVLPYYLLEENGIDENWLKENKLVLKETDLAPAFLSGMVKAISKTDLLSEPKRKALSPYFGKEADRGSNFFRYARWEEFRLLVEELREAGVKVCAGIVESDGKYRFLGNCFDRTVTVPADSGETGYENLRDAVCFGYDYLTGMIKKFKK